MHLCSLFYVCYQLPFHDPVNESQVINCIMPCCPASCTGACCTPNMKSIPKWPIALLPNNTQLLHYYCKAVQQFWSFAFCLWKQVESLIGHFCCILITNWRYRSHSKAIVCFAIMVMMSGEVILACCIVQKWRQPFTINQCHCRSGTFFCFIPAKNIYTGFFISPVFLSIIVPIQRPSNVDY